MIRATVAALLALLVSAAGGPLSAQTAAQAPAQTPSPAAAQAAAQMATDLGLERKLLALDLVSYREARAREQASRDQVTAAAQRLDQVLAGNSLALGTLETLFDDLSRSRAGALVAAERVDWQLQRLQDRLRRISFLEGEAGGRSVRTDTVAGRWQVVIQPQNATGVFELRLDGTVVSGTYQVGATAGSLRGTFTDNRLRLDRIDAKGGFDSIFLGTYEPAAQRITGSWTANELASGQPTRGDWSATRPGAGEERKP